jgi:hypothetical protein
MNEKFNREKKIAARKKRDETQGDETIEARTKSRTFDAIALDEMEGNWK